MKQLLRLTVPMFIAVMLFVTMITIMTGCTENTRVRVYGGTETINLEQGKRLVNVTWKQGNDLWILTKEDTTTKAGTYHFKEKSAFGVMEGEVIIIEK